MCDRFLIRLADGNEVCIPIYRETQGFKVGPDPDPGPYRDVLQDFTVLATTSQLATNLASGHARDQVGRAVQRVAADVSKQLPQGVSVGEATFATSARSYAQS